MFKRTVIIAAAAVLAASATGWALPNGLSGFSCAGGVGGPTTGYVTGEYSFPFGLRAALGPEVGVGFGDGSAFFAGGAVRVYVFADSFSIAQPHLYLSGGLAVADDETVGTNGAETGPYLDFGAGCDVDLPDSPMGPFVDLGAFVSPGGDPKVGFKIGGGLRLNIGRALWLEQRERERRAEEEFVARKLAEAREANDRGDFEEAIAICNELLEAYPKREEARVLIAESERLLAESIPEPEPEPEPEPRPRPRPEPEPEPEPEPVIPPEAVTAVNRGRAALAGGSLGEAIYIFSAVMREYPSYGAARAGLVEAYLLQGLDYYSRGSISQALAAWRKALVYDPGNAKVKRYMEKAERERQ
ncbi:MAG: hypothetical protein JSU81_03400 [Candidatus Coatesbacteria bacterium]|nr:MAG: hypothetical protein JSU81_03400 [Candidatus Coatesbacteria bacterium]